MQGYDHERLKQKVDEALRVVSRVLDVSRHPVMPTVPMDVTHTYEDKYTLAECMTNACLAAQLNTLATLGLDSEGLGKLLQWSKTHAVTLQFASSERCEFVEKTVKEVAAPTKLKKESSGFGGLLSTTHKVVTTVTTYHWKFDMKWALVAYCGTEEAERVVLITGAGKVCTC
jgi:hypothetical protein